MVVDIILSQFVLVALFEDTACPTARRENYIKLGLLEAYYINYNNKKAFNLFNVQNNNKIINTLVCNRIWVINTIKFLYLYLGRVFWRRCSRS